MTPMSSPLWGGGSVFFKKEPARIEVINDKDKDIAGFYKGVKVVDVADVRRINMIPSRTRYKKMIETNPTTPIKQIEKTMYLNKRSYSGKMGAGNYARSYEDENRRNTGATTIKQKFPEYQYRLKKVKVHNTDFEPVIKKYDSRTTFFYLDPPYHEVSKDCYTHEDVTPAQVHDSVKGVKGKFLISYNNHHDVREEFKKYNIETIKQTYELRGADNKQPVTELLISNYNYT